MWTATEKVLVEIICYCEIYGHNVRTSHYRWHPCTCSLASFKTSHMLSIRPRTSTGSFQHHLHFQSSILDSKFFGSPPSPLGLWLRALLFPPRPICPPRLPRSFLGGPRTNAKSAVMGRSRIFFPDAPAMAAFASSSVAYSISAYPWTMSIHSIQKRNGSEPWRNPFDDLNWDEFVESPQNLKKNP